jgi:hypothetical protein
MKYEKPELTALGCAFDAIRATAKDTHRIDSEVLPTANAYEADE